MGESASLVGISYLILNDYDVLHGPKVAHNTRSYQSMHLSEYSSQLCRMNTKSSLVHGPGLNDEQVGFACP